MNTMGKVKKKLGLSLVLSYVLLIALSLSLSTIIYVWLKRQSSIEEAPECPDGVSIIIQEYNCLSGNEIELTLKNHGRFNISGIYIRGTDDKNMMPLDGLIFDSGDFYDMTTEGEERGFYLFKKGSIEDSFPGDTHAGKFIYDSGSSLEKISVEPFRLAKNGEIILCFNAVVSQEVNC